MAPESSERIWRISLVVPFPNLQVAPFQANGAPPAQLEFASRIRPTQRSIDGTRIAIRATDRSLVQAMPGLPPWEAAEIIVEIEAGTDMSALEKARKFIELVMDRMSFDLALALQVERVEVRDVTPPVAAGDVRDVCIYSGYPMDKFVREVEFGSIQTDPIPRLHPDYAEPDPKSRAALRWYVKAFATPFQHDRFIFLWVATEILFDKSGIKVEKPYVADCGHEIKVCHECGKPTGRMVRGASILKYLEGRGVTSDLAKRAWQLRQMMHGAVPFDSEKLADLGSTIQMLRSVVAAELKTTMGLSLDAFPIVAAATGSIHPTAGVGGKAKIREEDLSWPA